MIGYQLLVNNKTVAAKKGDGEAIAGIKQNYEAAVAPGVTDDVTDGYAPGSQWIINQAGGVTDGDIYVCTDGSEGAANWELVHNATP